MARRDDGRRTRRPRSGTGDRRGVQPDAAGDDVATRLLPGDLDPIGGERLERLRLDQRQLVAAAATRERAATVEVAVALEPAARDGLGEEDAFERSLRGRCYEQSRDDAARLGGRPYGEATSRPSWNGAITTPSTSEPPRGSSPAGSSSGPDGTPNIRTTSRCPSGVVTAAIQCPGHANEAGSSIGTSPRFRPASHWRQKTFESPRPAPAAARARLRAPARGTSKSRVPSRSSEHNTRRVAPPPASSPPSVTFPRHGHLHDAVSRVQALVRRRAGDPRAAARRRAHPGGRACRTSP